METISRVFINVNKEGVPFEWSLGEHLDGGFWIDTDAIEGIDDFFEYYAAYVYKNGKLTKDVSMYNSLKQQHMANLLREQREIECFPIINRGGIWYELLTQQEKTELLSWYQAWLDATETLEIPIKPNWLK